MVSEKGGKVILNRIIHGLQQDHWQIEKDSDQWIIARKGEEGILFTVLDKGNFLEAPRSPFAEDKTIKIWEAVVFCPNGLYSADLRQPVLRKVQAWYIDMQTGAVFASPSTEKRERLNQILSYLEQAGPYSSDPVSPTPYTTEPQFLRNSPAAHTLRPRPLLTYIIIAINLIIFGLMTLAGGSTRTGVLILFGAKVNELILQGEVWRLFTSMFLHIGFLHLVFNLYALWALGPITEELMGKMRFLIIYIISGIMGSIASFLFTDAISAGASGAIFGLLGALVVYSRKKPFLWQSGFGKSLMVIILINLGLGLYQPGIDIYAHVGGLLSGALLTLFISMK